MKTLASLTHILLPCVLLLPFKEQVGGLNCSIIILVYEMVISHVMSRIYDNLSVVDEMWSILPMCYAYYMSDGSPRSLLMIALVTIWGVRLSYSLWRKGFYQGLEDYRWRFIFNKIEDPVKRLLFYIFFWTIWQHLLLFFLTIPVYLLPSYELNFFDAIVAVLNLAFSLIEAVADQQQWDFQTRKKKYDPKNETDEECEQGFVSTGLWRYSRHPNFFAEMGFWWTWYAFSQNLNFSILAIGQFTLVFQRTTKITEYFSKKKYPKYSEYQATTSKLIPWFSTRTKI